MPHVISTSGLQMVPAGGGGGGGNLTSGQPFTATGSGFGVKTNNALIWDDCTGSNITTKWSGAFTLSLNPTAYRTPAQTPYGVGLPTPLNTQYICGNHDGAGGNAQDVGFYNYRNFVEGSWSVWDFDARLNPSWTFGIGSPTDNNFKSYGIAGGHQDIYGDDYGNGTAGHVYDGSTNPPDDLNSLTADYGIGFNDDSGGSFTNMYSNRSSQYHFWPGSGTKTVFNSWSKWTRVTKWSATNGNGYITIQIDYGQTADYYRTPTRGGGTGTPGSGGSGAQVFYTDALNDATGTLRTEGLGGYTRNYPAATNWRYWCNIYFDFGLNPGRFYLCNNSTFSSATIRQIQPWNSGQWTDTSVGMTCFKGNLSAGTVFLFFVTEVTGSVVVTSIPGPWVMN